MKVLETAGQVWPLVALVALVATTSVGVTLHFANPFSDLASRVGKVEAHGATQDGKITKLEGQVQTLTTALSTAKSAEKIAEACSNYADQLATGIRPSGAGGGDELSEEELGRIPAVMAGLGCPGLKK